jgi:hypothetical protein
VILLEFVFLRRDVDRDGVGQRLLLLRLMVVRKREIDVERERLSLPC